MAPICNELGDHGRAAKKAKKPQVLSGVGFRPPGQSGAAPAGSRCPARAELDVFGHHIHKIQKVSEGILSAFVPRLGETPSRNSQTTVALPRVKGKLCLNRPQFQPRKGTPVKKRQQSARDHCDGEIEFLRSMVGGFNFHQICPLGRCRRHQACKSPRGGTSAGLGWEDRDVLEAGLPVCIAAMGFGQREEMMRLTYSGHFEPPPGWSVDQILHKLRLDARAARRKQQRQRQRKRQSSV